MSGWNGKKNILCIKSTQKRQVEIKQHNRLCGFLKGKNIIFGI